MDDSTTTYSYPISWNEDVHRNQSWHRALVTYERRLKALRVLTNQHNAPPLMHVHELKQPSHSILASLLEADALA